MSIYVLRSDNLVKIGFTDNLRTRVSAIISAVPVPVEFVGHMPGDREVEAHFHHRFSAQNFSGEWFVETEEMRLVFQTMLTPRLPDLPERERRDRSEQRRAQRELASEVKTATQAAWPNTSAGDRVQALANALGWRGSRVKDLYYADSRVALRSEEQRQLDKWLDAYRIAPEIKGEDDDR